jgi:hypothetical protein
MQGTIRNTQGQEREDNLSTDMALITIETTIGTIRIL